MSDINPGDRFGKLVTLERYAAPPRQGAGSWLCRCDCGVTVRVRASDLLGRHHQSCGCSRHKPAKHANRTHGMSGTSEHNIWMGMNGRCYRPTHHVYALYGGRGIAVCDRWRHSFESFYADMGPRPGKGYSIDRIDNDGPYSPENCRWATQRTQSANRNVKRLLTDDGVTRSLSEWSRQTGLLRSLIQQRIDRHGWSVHDALTTPVDRSRWNSRRSRQTV